MPENANEHALKSSTGAGTETTAGKPSPKTALPAVEHQLIDQAEALRRARHMFGSGDSVRSEAAAKLIMQAVQETAEECDEWARWNRERGMLIQGHIAGMLTEFGRRRLDLLNMYCDARMAVLATDSPFSAAWDVDPAPDSTRKRDGVAGDVQPLRPREQ